MKSWAVPDRLLLKLFLADPLLPDELLQPLPIDLGDEERTLVVDS